MRQSWILTTSLVLLFASNSYADVRFASTLKRPVKRKQVVIAVIDTGIDDKLIDSKTLCKEGHEDFTGSGLTDHDGHGTHISGIIDQYAKDYIFNNNIDHDEAIEQIDINYCQIIFKYFDPTKPNTNTIKNTVNSFKMAIARGVDIINYSSGGLEFSEEEHDIVIAAINQGIIVVAAAGNERSELMEKGKGGPRNHYYPAQYDPRIYVVGNLESFRPRIVAPTSNYGKLVNMWEVGTKVFSRGKADTWVSSTGTSQAAAIKSGKLIHDMLFQ